MFKKMKTKMFIILFNLIILSSKSSISLNSSEINGNLEAGLILIQGDFISSVNYNQFSNQLKSKFPGKLWLAIPDFNSSVPKLDQMKNQLNLAFENLKQSGCNLNMPFFFVGHSSGGIILQDYMLNETNRNSLPVKVAGIILEAAYVKRSNRNKLNRFKVI